MKNIKGIQIVLCSILHKKDKKNHLSEPNLLEQLMMVSDHLDVAFVSLAHIWKKRVALCKI